LKGKIAFTEEMQVSQDGNSITHTLHFAGQDKAVVFVYDRL
jgi:hypothetical protein